jgi:AraC-like DNA-binding protein
MAGRYIFAATESETRGHDHIAEGIKDVMSPALPDASDEKDFIPPEHLGKGRCVRVLSNDSCDMYSNELQLTRNSQLSAGTEGPLYTLQFCMGSSTEWQEEESGARLQMRSGQGTFSFISHVVETGEYQAGEHYKSFRVDFSPPKMERMVGEFGIAISAFARKRTNFSMSFFEITPECRTAIAEITHCRYSGSVRSLYIESKAQELLASCMFALQNKIKNNGLALSKSDRANLKRAKEIVDNHLSKPITLAKLARMVCLNEYKLKNGFKVLFGKPVYSYLLDKRMEYARLLLEKQGLHVYEAAEMAGYSDSSGFSKAFFKRYGYRPGDVS